MIYHQGAATVKTIRLSGCNEDDHDPAAATMILFRSKSLAPYYDAVSTSPSIYPSHGRLGHHRNVHARDYSPTYILHLHSSQTGAVSSSQREWWGTTTSDQISWRSYYMNGVRRLHSGELATSKAKESKIIVRVHAAGEFHSGFFLRGMILEQIFLKSLD
nr:hypothetical protein CFP56_60737 [Quercus suber]